MPVPDPLLEVADAIAQFGAAPAGGGREAGSLAWAQRGEGHVGKTLLLGLAQSDDVVVGGCGCGPGAESWAGIGWCRAEARYGVSEPAATEHKGIILEQGLVIDAFGSPSPARST
ncbi:hypothetical protein QFZ82_006918 [Streptomyces sp. V4I23]|uniref:hypothetical protein n=1 Tax=Streptomyces sp. V4I23 TaxID=3042282 RepID=UPI00278AF6C8|nr:hypothetical protein [Streptomyces sp. V4I23]MDQ1012433.1 hypothetical protein [Streptomyces sp. V4I23]